MKRPLGRYHGGKWKLGKRIISLFPQHRIYTEAYGGLASVLMQKQRAYSEIYNDVECRVITLFNVLRSIDSANELRRVVELTPFSREEFELSYQHSECAIEASRRFLFQLAAGHSTAGTSGKKTGFRSNTKRSSTTPCHDWRNFPQVITQAAERFRGVVIENIDAIELLRKYDDEECLHYVDPPYMAETRGTTATSAYRYEMTIEQHKVLLNTVTTLSGKVAISGYRCSLYDDMLADWRRVDIDAFADSAQKRIESVWMNYENLPLFRS